MPGVGSWGSTPHSSEPSPAIARRTRTDKEIVGGMASGLHPTDVLMNDHKIWARSVERFSTQMSDWTGSTAAFVSSVLLVFAWIVTGPVFRFSDTWQLVINTITNVVTFVMVFLIQRAQNKDSLAMQIKLSELLAVLRGADDRIVAVEELSEEELRHLHARYLQWARRGEDPLPGRLEASSAAEPRDRTALSFKC
jgi:low affinity Fe/Cu permease